MTDKYRCFYCDKKDRKTNHHWQCTCAEIEGKRVVQFYVCPECFEKIYIKPTKNKRGIR